MLELRVIPGVYDPASRRIAVEKSVDGVTATEYDCLDRLVSVTTDPLGCITAWLYDVAGQVVAEVDPLGGISTFSFAQCSIRPSDGRRLAAAGA